MKTDICPLCGKEVPSKALHFMVCEKLDEYQDDKELAQRIRDRETAAMSRIQKGE